MKTTFDPARELQIYLRRARQGDKTFIFTLSTGAAYSLTGKTFELVVKSFSHSVTNLIRLTIGNGLTIQASTNQLAIRFTVAQTTLVPKDYYWEFTCLDDNKTWLTGIATLHDGEFDGVDEDTTDLTISLNGADVNIEISLGGGSTTSGGHTIQDEGVSLTQRTKLNFVGGGVAATDDSVNDATIITVPGGAGGGDVVGPASAISDDIATYNGTTGKIIKDGAAKISDLQLRSEEDASNGYAGLTLLKINFKNVANTIISFFTNVNTVARTYTFPDKDLAQVAGLVDITDAQIASTDITTNNVTSTKHGFAPKSPADATQFLNGAATPAFSAVKDSDLSTTDITTNNVSTSKHGFAPKGSGAVDSYLNSNGAYSKQLETIGVACSDETTALTTGVNKVTFRVPFAMTLTAVRCSLSTAQGSGSIFTVNIKEAGTTILSTKLTIDNTEKTSTTAVTAPVISDATLADDAEMTVDIDQIGDGTAKGLKIWLIGART